MISNETRRVALPQARGSGQMVATGRIRLVRETGEQFGFLMILPVYSRAEELTDSAFRAKHLRGYTTAVLRVGSMLGALARELQDRDITERKRLDRLKSEFVSTVSHELRTPLTSISGALGLLAGGALGEFTGKVKKLIDMAHTNSPRLTTLINDLLDMDKLVAGKMTLDLQAQPLMPLVEQSLESIRAYGEQCKRTRCYNLDANLRIQPHASASSAPRVRLHRVAGVSVVLG